MKTAKSEKAAALMLALWALFLLSAAIMTWAIDIDARIGIAGDANRRLEAVAMACSGAEVAFHPLVKPGDPALAGQLSAATGYEARLTGEGGRLNLNWLLAGENPVRLEMLRRYLEVKGFDLNERDRMIDTLLDWADPDNLVRLNGAENDGDYRPSNTLFTRIDELRKVKGWEEFTARPDWDIDLTLNSNGPVDLMWAERDVLLTLPGFDSALVDRFLALRRGPDEIDRTPDDPEFESLDELRVALGFSTEQFQQIAPLLGFNDPVMRVRSTGRSGSATHRVDAVFRKTQTAPQLITWRES